MGEVQSEGYSALRDSAAWLDLSGRGKIAARGEDRARLLHAMTTNHVQQLEAGQGCYTFFLNAQGRVLADANLFASPDHILLDTEPETALKVFSHLERYIIADDVTLENATQRTATIGLEGPKAEEVLATLGGPAPASAWEHCSWGNWIVARADTTGAGGFLLFLPLGDKETLLGQLTAAGAMRADAAAARAVRLEHGKPRYGEDITESQLPQETQLLQAIHFNKGCYLGQEIVERIRSRGHVHRLLVSLEIDAAAVPPPDARVLSEETEVGRVTSAVWSPALGKTIALAYLKTDYAHGRQALSVESAHAGIRMSESRGA
jgi:folate-binding protein YgfZ